MLLAGDIGGTKTNLAIYAPEAGEHAPLVRQTFSSAKYPSLEALVAEFLSGDTPHVERAVFGVAGPVVQGTAKITNLPWTMDERHLASELDLKSVRLINDLEAIGYGVPYLLPDELQTINAGKPVEGGAIAVIAPGTGLGEAFLTWERDHYQARPSEGGHADFAPTDALQIGLLPYLLGRREHVSYERVCSGRGIPSIYAFLRDEGHAEEPAWLAERLRTAADPTPIIVETAVAGGEDSDICRQTLRMFTSILAAEAGNLTLKVLSVGGVYLGGGIPLRLLPFLDPERFMGHFTDKGRFTDLLRDVPVHVILHPDVGLLGAAMYGVQSEAGR